MNNSQAAAHDSWPMRCSPCTSGFSQSNLHDINHGRYSILLPWGLLDRHVPALDTYTPNSAFPKSPFLTDFHRSTTRNYHPTTTVYQEESAPLSPMLEVAPPSPPYSSSLTSNPKELSVSIDHDVPYQGFNTGLPPVFKIKNLLMSLIFSLNFCSFSPDFSITQTHKIPCQSNGQALFTYGQVVFQLQKLFKALNTMYEEDLEKNTLLFLAMFITSD